MQQHFLNKYHFQRVPNQVEKLRKFQGVGGGGGMISTPWNGNSSGVGVLKQNARPLGVEGYGYFLKLHIDRSLSTKNIN